MNNELYHIYEADVKNLCERAQEADTVSELCDISFDLGKLVQKVYNLYGTGQLDDTAYRSIIGDTNDLMDYILCQEVTE